MGSPDRNGQLKMDEKWNHRQGKSPFLHIYYYLTYEYK